MPSLEHDEATSSQARGLRHLRFEAGSGREDGAELFRSVFKGEVRERWLQSLKSIKEGGGLRLKLRLEGVPGLVGLPWECLYDPDQKSFLALKIETPVVRYLEVAAEDLPLKPPIPLKMLVMTANPEGTEALDIEPEIQAIKQALAPLGSRVQIKHLDRPSLADLEGHLRECHVLHFIGHGSFDDRSGSGALILEGRDGQPRTVDAHDLAGLLPKRHALRMVVLNSCEGARHSDEDVFSGVAQALVQKGVPAVVAMRHDIGDEAAVLFARKLYESLAHGVPIHEAVTLARKAISSDHGTAWSIPALYMRQDLRLFPSPRWKGWAIVVAVSCLALLSGLAWYEVPRLLAFYECPSPPGLGMRFVKIPGGSFEMGSGNGADGPVHQVTLTKPFCLAVYEVTQRQWTAIMHSNPSFAAGDDHPVETVSWQEAHDFLKKLNELDPRGHYRLPTEAQWEYAASDGGAGIYGFGDDEELLPKYGNCTGSRSGKTMAVGALLETTHWGLHDMHGNVAEWVEDFGAYGTDPAIDPVAPPRADAQRSRRGGSFLNNADHCRAAARSFVPQGKESYDTGFRIVRDPMW